MVTLYDEVKKYTEYSVQSKAGQTNLIVKHVEEKENWIKRGLRNETSAYNGYYQSKQKWVVDMNNGKSYIESVVKDHAVTSVKQSVLGGLPTISGRRIPISTIIACLSEEQSIDDICDDYDLTSEQIKSTLNFIVDILNRPYYSDER